MTDRDRIIDYMKTWVGYTEKDTRDKVGASMDSPEPFASKGKNNYTIFAKEYFKQTGIQVQGEPWCDTFIDACFIKVFGKEKARQYLGVLVRTHLIVLIILRYVSNGVIQLKSAV